MTCLFDFFVNAVSICKEIKNSFSPLWPSVSLVRNRTGGEKEIATGTSRSTRDDHFDRAEDDKQVHDGYYL